MDRDSLALLLGQGLSLAEIGRRFGRDESTVGYWVRKHGLVAVNAEKHAARGGLSRELLSTLIEQGLSLRAIARRTGFAPTTVRYWMRRYGLATPAGANRAEARRAKTAGSATVVMECATHGETRFWLEGRGVYRCLRCRNDRVAERRRRIKAILVAEAGGACIRCGYDRYVGALHFHHRDPQSKSFALGNQGITRALHVMREEAAKCDLVCANCHAEIEAEFETVTEAADTVMPGTNG